MIINWKVHCAFLRTGALWHSDNELWNLHHLCVVIVWPVSIPYHNHQTMLSEFVHTTKPQLLDIIAHKNARNLLPEKNIPRLHALNLDLCCTTILLIPAQELFTLYKHSQRKIKYCILNKKILTNDPNICVHHHFNFDRKCGIIFGWQ